MIRIAVSVYAAMICDRMHFAQASYRDGEWACMLGYRGRNVNGEAYDPALGEALRRTLLEPAGQWCVFWNDGAQPELRERAVRWVAEHEPRVRWIAERPFAKANGSGEAGPFLRAMRTRRVVLVGPDHMRRLPADVLAVAHHVPVPHAMAWESVDRIADEVRRVVEPDDLVLFAAGMASNLLIHRLWGEMRGAVTLYDIGAHLDPYCGVYSRSTFRSERWRKNIMPKNIRG